MMLKRIYSWLAGRKIGEVQFAIRKLSGGIIYMLPSDLLTEKKKGEIVIHYDEYVWTGWKWEITKKQSKFKDFPGDVGGL